MKELIINSILLVISIVTVTIFLEYIKRKYGRRPSISNSVKYLTQDGNQIYFYIFITIGICVPLTFIVYNFLSAISAGMLFVIGIVTGYNPKIKDNRLEDTIHVVLTNLAIVGTVVSIVLMNYWLSIIVILYGVPCFVLWIIKAEDHTWRIEVLIIYMIWTCLIIEKILSLLIKL